MPGRAPAALAAELGARATAGVPPVELSAFECEFTRALRLNGASELVALRPAEALAARPRPAVDAFYDRPAEAAEFDSFYTDHVEEELGKYSFHKKMEPLHMQVGAYRAARGVFDMCTCAHARMHIDMRAHTSRWSSCGRRG